MGDCRDDRRDDGVVDDDAEKPGDDGRARGVCGIAARRARDVERDYRAEPPPDD